MVNSVVVGTFFFFSLSEDRTVQEIRGQWYFFDETEKKKKWGLVAKIQSRSFAIHSIPRSPRRKKILVMKLDIRIFFFILPCFSIYHPIKKENRLPRSRHLTRSPLRSQLRILSRLYGRVFFFLLFRLVAQRKIILVPTRLKKIFYVYFPLKEQRSSKNGKTIKAQYIYMQQKKKKKKREQEKKKKRKKRKKKIDEKKKKKK